MDTATRRIKRRLEKDGWFLSRRGGAHDIYRRPKIEGIAMVRGSASVRGRAAIIAPNPLRLPSEAA